MNTRWKSSGHAIYNCSYHLIWCTKYRRRVLTDQIQNRLKQLLITKATEHGWTLGQMEIMEDHVHLFVKVGPTDCPAFVVSQFKGISSFSLRKEFAELRTKLPTLWTRSYYAESIGHISEETIKKYIADQKNK